MGLKPLLQWRFFTIEINLRIDIQRDLFSGGFTLQNDKFYHWIWNNKIQACEESGTKLYNYSSKYVSHIISRGAARDMATDPRNCNLLTPQNHAIWETGNRKHMSIYRQNMYVINLLKQDYGSI